MRRLLILLTIFSSLVAGWPSSYDNMYTFNPTNNNILIHKQFYTHSGPEAPLEKKITFGKASKTFRIIFVNIPSRFEGLRQNGIQLLQVSLAPVEEKLALYVLSPQRNEQHVEIANFETPPLTTPSAPEVHFGKYKDKEDIEVVRMRIRDHYVDIDSQ